MYGYNFFECATCKVGKPVKLGSLGTGYGISPAGEKVCYQCCAKRDAEDMKQTGKATLYLVTNGASPWGAKVTNWPGSLSFPVGYVSKGRHNMARVRYDFRFTGPDGAEWAGTQYGDNTQIAHCKRLKK